MKAFVLYIEHDIGPHCVSVHETLSLIHISEPTRRS